MVRRRLKIAAGRLLVLVPFHLARLVVRAWCIALAHDPDPRRGARRLLEVEAEHDFFLGRVAPDDRVLDVG